MSIKTNIKALESTLVTLTCSWSKLQAYIQQHQMSYV